jgi:signal transduction histidine kinase
LIEVHDDGPGIPESQRETIFEPFVRLNAKATVPGTGLGLAISRDLARGMGGDVSVSSENGRGSCFVVRIPLSTRFADGAL